MIDNIFQSSPFWKNDWKIPTDPDPFETFVRETRAEAGIVDPPRQPVCGGGRSTAELLSWGIEESGSPGTWNGKNYTTYEDLDKS